MEPIFLDVVGMTLEAVYSVVNVKLDKCQLV